MSCLVLAWNNKNMCWNVRDNLLWSSIDKVQKYELDHRLQLGLVDVLLCWHLESHPRIWLWEFDLIPNSSDFNKYY